MNITFIKSKNNATIALKCDLRYEPQKGIFLTPSIVLRQCDDIQELFSFQLYLSKEQTWSDKLALTLFKTFHLKQRFFRLKDLTIRVPASLRVTYQI